MSCVACYELVDKLDGCRITSGMTVGGSNIINVRQFPDFRDVWVNVYCPYKKDEQGLIYPL